MPRKTTPRPRFAGLEDPAGEAWMAEARQRLHRAENRARSAAGDASPAEFFTAPPLPHWPHPAALPSWIEPYGRYAWGGEQRLLHDLEAPAEGCELDRLTHAGGVHFIHFAAELAGAVPADVATCSACMGGAS